MDSRFELRIQPRGSQEDPSVLRLPSVSLRLGASEQGRGAVTVTRCTDVFVIGERGTRVPDSTYQKVKIFNIYNKMGIMAYFFLLFKNLCYDCKFALVFNTKKNFLILSHQGIYCNRIRC